MRTTTMPWTAELMEMLRASETQEPDFARWGLLHSAGEWGRPRGLQFHLHALLHPINLTALILACCAIAGLGQRRMHHFVFFTR